MRTKWLTLGLVVMLGMGCKNEDTVTVECDGGDCSASGGETSTGGSASTGGETSTGGSASTGGETSTGGSTSTGGAMDDDDAGMGTGGDAMGSGGNMMGTGGEYVPPKTDGTALAACQNDRDCNMGLGCVRSGNQGEGHCSTTCTMDDECTALGATAICSMTYDLCAFRCDGLEDTSCPNGMTCQLRGGFGGFLCQYPEPPPEMAALWEACGMPGVECVEGTTCDNTLGYCTATCTLDSECGDPATGSITPSCQSAAAGPDECVLDCAADETACPTGMECQMVGFPPGVGPSRCVIP